MEKRPGESRAASFLSCEGEGAVEKFQLFSYLGGGASYMVGCSMSVHFYNTLNRRLEPFQSIEPGRVKFYSCGPTVYNFAHVGNYRAYIFEDLVHRYLEFRGLDVMQVMNLTDVDDKTIRGALEQNLPLKDYTRPFIEAFFSRPEGAQHYAGRPLSRGDRSHSGDDCADRAVNRQRACLSVR
jgi:hypothetical protein